MKRLLVIYHSQSGRTEQLASAIVAGAKREADVEVRLRRALEADLQDLCWADGVLFGTPENFGTLSGALKDFFDRTFYPAQPLQLHLPYAQFISAGNDGTGAVRQMDRILKGYPMKKVADPLIVKGDPSDDSLQEVADLGQAMAAGLSMGIY